MCGKALGKLSVQLCTKVCSCAAHLASCTSQRAFISSTGDKHHLMCKSCNTPLEGLLLMWYLPLLDGLANAIFQSSHLLAETTCRQPARRSFPKGSGAVMSLHTSVPSPSRDVFIASHQEMAPVHHFRAVVLLHTTWRLWQLLTCAQVSGVFSDT